jgi:hypothetical protein
MDKQRILISYYSYTYSNRTLTQTFNNPAVEYLKTEGYVSFVENPIWEHTVGDYDYFIEVENRQATVNGQLIDRFFVKGMVGINVQRKSVGVVMRLGIPIMFMCLLSATTFWAAQNTRVDTTLTLLLAIAALYIVVFSNIPLLGYLTKFDLFAIRIFIILVIVVGFHQLVDRIHVKKVEWPLRKLYVRIVEFLGRVVIIPSVVAYFLSAFPNNLVTETKNFLISITVICFTAIVIREYPGVSKSYKTALQKVEEKLNSDEAKKISKIEALFYNLNYHKKFSLVLDGQVKMRSGAPTQNTLHSNSKDGAVVTSSHNDLL